MRRASPASLLAALALLAAAGHPAQAAAACAQHADGRCEDAGAACNPPADGRCTTGPPFTLTRLKHSCRCLSPRQWGPQASGTASTACRNRCNGREMTCASSARSYNQRNACVSRNATCNSHC